MLDVGRCARSWGGMKGTGKLWCLLEETSVWNIIAYRRHHSLLSTHYHILWVLTTECLLLELIDQKSNPDSEYPGRLILGKWFNFFQSGLPSLYTVHGVAESDTTEHAHTRRLDFGHCSAPHPGPLYRVWTPQPSMAALCCSLVLHKPLLCISSGMPFFLLSVEVSRKTAHRAFLKCKRSGCLTVPVLFTHVV